MRDRCPHPASPAIQIGRCNNVRNRRETGGKQYKVEQGDVLSVEKLNVAEGETVDLSVRMLVDGETRTIGSPVVEGAKVT